MRGTPGLPRLAAAALCAALAGCATAPPARPYPVPTPVLPAPAVPFRPIPLAIAVSVEPVEPVRLARGDAAWELALDEPLRHALGMVARSLSWVDPAAASSVAGGGPGATLHARVASLELVPPIRLELATDLVTGQGEALASVRRTGWGPAVDDLAARRLPEDAAAELSVAIASAAARTRDALAVAPGVVALQPPASTPGPLQPPAAPDLRPRITGFWDLRWAADRDPVVAARAETLASRRAWSKGLAGVGAACLFGAGLALIPKKECAYGVCTEEPVTQPEVAAVFGITAAVSFVAALLVWPYDATGQVVALWNRRHPDQPLEVAPPPPPAPEAAAGLAPNTVP